MKIDNHHLEYIMGKLFSSGLNFPISDEKRLVGNVLKSRLELLDAYCRGESVLHIGCADHMELIDSKRKNGTWLHERLTESASRCLGIDINKETLKYITKHAGMSNVIYADVTDRIPLQVANGAPWEKVVLGEIIEHLGNPVHFLEQLWTSLSEFSNELIITAPNALRFENYQKARKSAECINSDHRFWFTPYTLIKIVADAGFKPLEFDFATSFNLSRPKGPWSLLRYFRLRRFPALRDTIILKAKF